MERSVQANVALTWLLEDGFEAAEFNLCANGQRRARVLALQQYQDRTWSGAHLRRHPRYLSQLLLPLAIWLLVGWPWAVLVLAGFVAGYVFERAARARMQAFLEREREAPGQDPSVIQRTTVLGMCISVLCYIAPMPALALASAPGPAIGLMMSCVTIMLTAGHQTLTRHMFLPAFAASAISLAANAAALGGGGWVSLLLTCMAGLLALNCRMLNLGLFRSAQRTVASWLETAALANTLEHKVEARTRELAGALELAQDANRAKSVFLANMSHELRTPLNAILGFTEIVREGAELDGRTQDLADLDRVSNAGRHLLQVISDVLDLSKIEAGKLTLQPAVFDGAAILRESVEMLRPAVERNGNRLLLDIAPNVGPLHTDPLRLRQCLLNLLSNAAKFTRDGTVCVTARRLARADGDALEVRVRDTGIGIAPDVLPRLFRPFCQADEGVTRAFGGTGLGLAIASHFAQAMRGAITVTSQPGIGSEFVLTVAATLPCAPTAEAA